jgi:hypothetical protein
VETISLKFQLALTKAAQDSHDESQMTKAGFSLFGLTNR